ncbi:MULTISPECIES: hypothetical protein [unclassified Paenibacillus]|uniref:hypothetical protein n=1 Tax=unclassified Paenibacillus TaxID=185978 RepID=UPI0027884712|nr:MULTISPECIES: hypothetical protein [unclassified Paenibacillus]MDQ0896202.1 hypothetical protein [Paenibacillus sp. V4I7]MDQ0913982.1 hypothetical protein [Paenibacillus sp. V4I5]
MKKLRKKFPYISLTFIAILLFLGALLSVISKFSSAEAATTPPQSTVDVQYTSSSGYTVGSEMFDATPTLATDNFSITAPVGYVIDNVTVTQVDGTTGTVSPELGSSSNWKGQSTWTGKAIVPGLPQTVSSIGNNSEQGYWAWYRYIKNDPRSPYWYADLNFSDGSSQKVKSKPSAYPSDPDTIDSDGTGLPAYPGFTSSSFGKSLQLVAARNKAYYLGSTYIHSTAVASSSVRAIDKSLDTAKPIDGPAGVDSGYTMPSTIPSFTVASGGDSDHYNIDAVVDFNQASYYSKQLNSPANGAAVMVYYYAFTVDLEGTTYRYRPKVNVTFAPAPTTADLGNLAVTSANSCFTPGTAETFNFSFQNYGTQDINSTITAHVRVDGSPLQDFTYGSGLRAGQKATGSFTYTFSAATTKSFTLIVDSLPGESNTSDNIQSFMFTAKSTCMSPETVTADFIVQKPSIPFGDKNGIQANNISVSGGSGCSIQEVAYTITQNGNSEVKKSTSAFSFDIGGFTPQPKWLSVGTVTVTLKVTSTCGGQATAGPKSFEVTKPVSCTPSNNAPQFKAGFVYHGASSMPYAVDTAFPGDWLDVQIIQDTISDPATPRDPDGDPYYFYWDWSGAAAKDSWLKKYVDDYDPWEYEERYSFPFSMRLTSAEDGTHSIDVYATDLCGNTSMSKASVTVMEPNPIPAITLPPKVVEGRPFSPDISGASSWSPMKRSITGYDWHNTKQAVYPSAGNYSIKLDVTDSAGLRSLSPANATLNVLPDLPPIADASLASKGLRGIAMNMHDSSFSPDGDTIVKHVNTITCDTNLNGVYTDDPVTTVTPDGSGNFTFTPTVLSSCKLKIYVEEDWGKSATKEFLFTVVNQQPTLAIDVKGDMPAPPVVEGVNYNMQELLTDTSRFKVDDAYSANRLAGMYYDPTEKALAAPARSYSLYSVPTNGTFSMATTGYDMYEYVWGTRGQTYVPMGERGSKDSWYRFATDGSFMCSSACWTPYGYYFSVFDARTNTARTMSSTDSTRIWEAHVNPVADMLWMRSYNHPRSCSSDYWRCPSMGTVTDRYSSFPTLPQETMCHIKQQVDLIREHIKLGNMPSGWYLITHLQRVG